MKYRHYAPHAPVTAVCGDPEKGAAYIASQLTGQSGVICVDQFADRFPVISCAPSAVRTIRLHRRTPSSTRCVPSTKPDVTAIFAQCPDDSGIGLAVANRLKKAAGFHVIEV